MKTGYLGKWFLGVAVSALLVGCGGKSSSNSAVSASKGISSLSGVLGDVTKSGRAILKVDKDDNGKYGDKDDLTLSVEAKDGAFRFDHIETPVDKLLHTQLVVTVDGFVPFQKAVSLSNGSAIMVDASAAINKPSLKEAVKIGNLSASARMGMVVQFGIRKGATGLESFSRLVSLSQLGAEDGVGMADSVSTYQFGLGSFDDDVKVVEATMQAFDSTKEGDIKNFPGTFRGYGEDGAKSAASGEVGLESAAFDLFELRDQNGQKITLKTDKVGASVDLSNCTNRWTRNITSAQAAVVEGWGDYDDADPGYQVPIWSNDNSESAWKFVGVANLNDTHTQFEMCIPDDWGSGYLNCDSPIAFEKPTNLCVNAVNQNAIAVSGLSLNGRNGGQYLYAYTNNDGFASMGITDNNISAWTFSYTSYFSGYSSHAIDSDDIIEVNTTACNYELNLTIVDPYSAEVKVTARNTDGNLAVGAYVTLSSNVYGHYLSKGGTTDANGSIVFTVEPGISYVARYNNGTAEVTVDGVLSAPETADNGAYADVTVTDVNLAPEGFVYFPGTNIVNQDIVDSLPAEISGWDSNGDTLQVTALTVDGTAVTLLNASVSAAGGNYYQYGDLSVSGLALGLHTLMATISDGTNSVQRSATFKVEGNRAPVIGEMLSAYKYAAVPEEMDDSSDLYLIETTGTTIKAAFYSFTANTHDPDGDTVSVAMMLDGAAYNPEFTVSRDEVVAINNGQHTMIVTATDELNSSASKTFVFNVGNQKPIITRAGSFADPINLSLGSTGTVYAYAEDPDGDGVSSVVASFGATDQNLTLGGASYFWHEIDANALGLGEHNITFVAMDGTGELSLPYIVTVTVINQNMPPEFYYPLYDRTIDVGETVIYSEIALMDPEGDRMTLSCTVDGVAYAVTPSESGMIDSYQMSVSGLVEGTHPVVCTATDSEGASATDTATITVIDPTKTVPMTIRTLLPGLTVTIHDANDNLKMLQSAVTDASGDVTFSLPAGTTTTSFSLDFDPTVVLTSDQVFAEMKSDVINRAYNNCSYTLDLNVSECAGADWCAIMIDEDNIPAWVIDAARLKDKDDNNVTGATSDTNSDGEISKAEFYTQAVNAINAYTGAAIDANGDGQLSWGEVDEKDVFARILVNVPVRTYVFNFDNDDDYHDHEYDSLNCNDFPSFDINVTNASGYVSRFSASGTGYGSGYADGANEFGGKVTIYGADSDGKYDFLVKFYDTNYDIAGGTLLFNKEADDLSSGFRYDGSMLPMLTTREVNMTNDANFSSMDIHGEYKGIYLLGSCASVHSGGTSVVSSCVSDTKLNYVVSALKNHYDENTSVLMSYEHRAYYGDGILQNSYLASDYPMIDLSVDTGGDMVRFSGADKASVDMSKIKYGGMKYSDDAYYMVDTFEIEIYRYTNQTADFNTGELNVTEMFPAGFAGVMASAMSDSNATQMKVSAYEYKNKTGIQVLDMEISGDFMGEHTLAMRSFTYDDSTAGGGSAEKIERAKTAAENPFKIRINAAKLLR